MNYSLIRNCDIANGPGVRVSLFVSGCTRHCPGCFQPETWDFSYGEPFTLKTQMEILQLLKPNYIDGLTVLGGEPFEPCNQSSLLPFVETVRKEYPNKTIWFYSGYTYEQFMDRTGDDKIITEFILDKIDILVDGPFIQDKKNVALTFRGSENQRIINIMDTMACGEIVLWEQGDRRETRIAHS